MGLSTGYHREVYGIYTGYPKVRFGETQALGAVGYGLSGLSLSL